MRSRTVSVLISSECNFCHIVKETSFDGDRDPSPLPEWHAMFAESGLEFDICPDCYQTKLI
jgi:hypothetical protein